MSSTKKIKTALVSVFHKDGLEALLAKLHEEGVQSSQQVVHNNLLNLWVTPAKRLKKLQLIPQFWAAV